MYMCHVLHVQLYKCIMLIFNNYCYLFEYLFIKKKYLPKANYHLFIHVNLTEL